MGLDGQNAATNGAGGAGLKVLSDENRGGSKLVSIDSSCFTV